AFWELFGRGRSPGAAQMYRDGVRRQLSPWARRYWDRHLHYFSGRGWRRSFYYHGGWGTMMWLFVNYWKEWRGLREPIAALFRAGSLQEQQDIYQAHLRGRLWTPGLN